MIKKIFIIISLITNIVSAENIQPPNKKSTEYDIASYLMRDIRDERPIVRDQEYIRAFNTSTPKLISGDKYLMYLCAKWSRFLVNEELAMRKIIGIHNGYSTSHCV